MRSVFVAIVAVIAMAVPASASVSASGVFEPYRAGATAITYVPEKVPPGTRVTVVPFSTGRGTVVLLLVHGLVPDRHYGAHVHVKPCGPLPADAGPHFQNVADPVKPSVDPAYANPRNEIWLDFVTSRTGGAIAVAKVPWKFGDRPAESVVIHDEHTHTVAGEAGTAGPRLACVNTHR